MSANTFDLLGQHSRGSSDGAAGEDNGTRGESAKAIGADSRVAIAQRDPLRVDSEFVSCNLRQRGFVALSVVLNPDIDDHATVGQHADIRRLVARNHAEL